MLRPLGTGNRRLLDVADRQFTVLVNGKKWPSCAGSPPFSQKIFTASGSAGGRSRVTSLGVLDGGRSDAFLLACEIQRKDSRLSNLEQGG
jgi:hypothetical protein